MSSNIFNSNTANIHGGVLFSYKRTITINTSMFQNNTAGNGGVLLSYNSSITINASVFQNNTADKGGVLWSHYSTVTINASIIQNNIAGIAGGALMSFNSTITINASTFQNNTASEYEGGVLLSYSNTITINASMFQNNTSAGKGGVLASYYSIIIIDTSIFQNNTADQGGALSPYHNSKVTIEASEFDSNSAATGGGVLDSHNNTTITIRCSNFTENSSPIGAVIAAGRSSKIQYHNYLLIANNTVEKYAIIYLLDSQFKGGHSGNITISNNLGSLMAFNSNVNISGYAIFVNNQPPQTAIDNFQEGGAITLFQSNIFFDGKCNLEHNHAKNGGAMHSTDSKLYVNGNVTIAHNRATGNGGGVYLSTSELNCQQNSTLVLFNNTAVHKGGGLHATSSFIKATSKLECIHGIDCYDQPERYSEYLYIGTRITFTKNAAKKGGGLSLEANVNLYILKYNNILYSYTEIANDINTTVFTGNSADYGGAVYVDDDTNSGTCASDPKTECFFQVLALYDFVSGPDVRTQDIYFSKNSADISGSTLYGGLLDRCAISQFAEVYKKYGDIDGGGGLAYFRNVSLATNISISSRPV